MYKKDWPFVLLAIITVSIAILLFLRDCTPLFTETPVVEESIQPAEPAIRIPDKVEKLIVKSKDYNYKNFSITVTDYDFYAEVEYPQEVAKKDVLDFLAWEIGKNPYLSDCCSYEFLNENSIRITYPKDINGFDYSDLLAEEIVLFLQEKIEESGVEPQKHIAEAHQHITETHTEAKPTAETEIPVAAAPLEEAPLAEAPKSNQKKGFSVSVVANPFAVQRINYEDNDPLYRDSSFGTGVGIRISYSLNQKVSIGTDILYEYHKFGNFHNYHDLKVNARLRMLVYPLSKDKRLTVKYSIGAGADFVFRDDGDCGCYPLFVVSGVDFDYKANDRLSLMTGLDCTFTCQKGSDVFHLTPFVGFTYNFYEGEAR